jgi:hemolysin activation/secretion protein
MKYAFLKMYFGLAIASLLIAWTAESTAAQFIQVGTFRDRSNAIDLTQRIQSNGIDNVMVVAGEPADTQIYLVRIGPLSGTSDFDAKMKVVEAVGIEDAYRVSAPDEGPILAGVAITSTELNPVATAEPSPAAQAAIQEIPYPTLPDGVEFPDLAELENAQFMTATILVSDIELEGNTLLSDADLAAALSPYIGRQLSFEDLQAARDDLTQAYVQKGYISSGVLIPNQEISDGIVKMVATEGELGSIQLQGNRALRSRYIENRLRADLGAHLNVYELEESLLLLQKHPMIAQVNAEVVPGSERGESLLALSVQEVQPFSLNFAVNNYRAPSVGENQAIASILHRSLLGFGDYFTASYAWTRGLNDFFIGYGAPLTRKDLTLEVYYSQGDTDIVEAPFNVLDIVSEVETVGLKLSQPIIRAPNQDLVLGLTFENIETESFLLDAPFSFSPGEQVGVSEVSALRLNTVWNWRHDADAVTVLGIMTQGVDWLDATDNSAARDLFGNPINDLPDSNFTAFFMHANYAHRFPWNGMMILSRLTGQVASDPLLSVEKLIIGGAQTVRGYRQNQLVRDNGVIVSTELRFPLVTNDVGQSRIGLTVAPFIDYGWGKNDSIGLPGLDDPQGESLFSMGAGLIWNWWEPLYAEVYYGIPLTNDENIGNDTLQERGVTFQVALQWSFGGGR